MNLICTECNYRFFESRILTKVDDEKRTLYNRLFNPIHCHKCNSQEIERIIEQTPGVPNIGAWSTQNEYNRKEWNRLLPYGLIRFITKSLIDGFTNPLRLLFVNHSGNITNRKSQCMKSDLQRLESRLVVSWASTTKWSETK